MPEKKAGLVPPPPGTLTLSRVAAREDMLVMDESGSGSRARSPMHFYSSLHDLPAIYSNEICPPSEVTGPLTRVQYPQGKKAYLPSFPLDKTEYLPLMRHRSINYTQGQAYPGLTCTYSPHSPLPEALNETSLTPNMAQTSGISDWLPPDDGIQIYPLSYSTNSYSVRKVIDDNINVRLYCPSQKPRLLAFREFCP